MSLILEIAINKQNGVTEEWAKRIKPIKNKVMIVAKNDIQ